MSENTIEQTNSVPSQSLASVVSITSERVPMPKLSPITIISGSGDDGEQLIDYRAGFFTHYFIVEGKKLYASIHTQYTSDGEFTGVYDVYLMHHYFMSMQFSICKDIEDGKEIWVSDDKPELIEDEYIDEIGKAIDNWVATRV